MNKILIHRDSPQEIRDKKYGLPELKKYPMPDADHVRAAIRFFNYVEPHNEEKLAKAILNRMKEYGMTFDEFTVGKDNRFSKYIPESHLEHHGILGQKWGEENGPPYPLDYDSHSTAEKQKNPDSKIGGGNGSMSKKEISRTLGFDLSKYSFESVFSKDGVNRNVERNFQMFGFSVKELIAQQGEAGAIEYLQKEWGFSKEDAESAVRNLDKVWQDHTIKDKDDNKDKTKKSSSRSSGGSQKAAKAEQQKEENKTEETKPENDSSDNQYAIEYLTAISEHYDDYVKEYDTLKQEEKDLLESEHGVEDADGYAQYAAKNELVEKFKMSDEVAESIVMVYRESLSDAKGSIENDKEAIELVSKIIEASNTIDTLSNLKVKKQEARGLKHSDIGNAFVDLYLAHHGIEGQKWGVRRYQNPDGSLTPEGRARYEKQMFKKDMKWIKKNERKIHDQAKKESKKELNEYSKLLSQKYGLNKNGKLSAAYVNNFNRGMAALMNDKVADLRSPSGRLVKFIAKRGELGVYTALADQGYDMSQVKNGVWTSGRIAYRKTEVTKVDVDDDRYK